jgi:hypothetical protein
MMADTKVIIKPSTSRLIQTSLCLKLTTGSLVIAFFGPCRVDRVLGLRSEPASDLTFTGLRSGSPSGLTFTGLRSGLASGLTFTGLRSEPASGLTFTGLRSGPASGLTFTGLDEATGLFIRKSIDIYKHNRFYLLGSVLINNTEKLRLVFQQA